MRFDKAIPAPSPQSRDDTVRPIPSEAGQVAAIVTARALVVSPLAAGFFFKNVEMPSLTRAAQLRPDKGRLSCRASLRRVQLGF